MSLTVDTVMKYPVITACSDESLLRVAARMEQFGVGGLPVIENGKLVGIITSRDVRRSHPNRLVMDAMSCHPVTIQKEATIWEAFQLMSDRNVERLPVLNGKDLVGVITRTDLLLELGKHTDSLTGLYTSGFIKYIGEQLLNEGVEITVMLFDLNNFGQFNKDYGHVMGDRCLRVFSQALSQMILPGKDYLCRYGGDEFVIITRRPREEAVSWAETVMAAIEKAFCDYRLSVKASVGITGGRHNQEVAAAITLEQMINLASLISTEAKKEERLLLVSC